MAVFILAVIVNSYNTGQVRLRLLLHLPRVLLQPLRCCCACGGFVPSILCDFLSQQTSLQQAEGGGGGTRPLVLCLSANQSHRVSTLG